jgi:hypothetical protein
MSRARPPGAGGLIAYTPAVLLSAVDPAVPAATASSKNALLHLLDVQLAEDRVRTVRIKQRQVRLELSVAAWSLPASDPHYTI